MSGEREGMASETAEILTELRAIHALLEAQREDEMRCPHGGTGICMYCLIPIFEHAVQQGVRL